MNLDTFYGFYRLNSEQYFVAEIKKHTRFRTNMSSYTIFNVIPLMSSQAFLFCFSRSPFYARIKLFSYLEFYFNVVSQKKINLFLIMI